MIYGSASGLTATADQSFSQSTPGVVGRSEPGDNWAIVSVCGDLNADGYADVVLGAPLEDGLFRDVRIEFGSDDRRQLLLASRHKWCQRSRRAEGSVWDGARIRGLRRGWVP